MSTDRTGRKHSPLLISTGACAFLWIVARACVQSMTIDESDTFLVHVARANLSDWEASSNNHVLNSLLMRLFVMVFGASPFTIRLPALVGAAVYIAAVYFLVRLITPKLLLQWSLLVCLVASPFVMDYLVAARGYSLALAFLTCAITLAVRHKQRGGSLYKAAAFVSVSLALSICANFSFAIADVATGLLILIWMWRDAAASRVKTLAALVLPGLAVGYFFVGPMVLAWPKGQFTWGAQSLLETGRSLLAASLYEPNPYLLNPPLNHYFVHFGTFLYPLLGVFFLWRAVLLLRARSTASGAAPAVIAAIALTITLCCHQLLFWFYGILLPLDRTGLYIALFLFLMAGVAAAVPLDSFQGRITARAMTGVLALIACYSLGCLRLTYFREWKYDADMKKVYSVLAYYNRTYGLTDVSVNWRYVAAINTYRKLSGHETLHQIGGAPTKVNEYPAGYQAYVIFYPWDRGFMKREGLKMVYHDAFTEVAVAIRPGLESQPCAHP
ncbi:MAG: hypothetical protein ABSF62_18550 [Bryobacteraceae bacterium]